MDASLFGLLTESYGIWVTLVILIIFLFKDQIASLLGKLFGHKTKLDRITEEVLSIKKDIKDIRDREIAEKDGRKKWLMEEYEPRLKKVESVSKAVLRHTLRDTYTSWIHDCQEDPNFTVDLQDYLDTEEDFETYVSVGGNGATHRLHDKFNELYASRLK